MYADQGVRFLPARKAGDEMFLLAVLHSDRAGSSKKMPTSVPADMIHVFHEELATYNASNNMPIPMGTSGAGIIRPEDYQGRQEQNALLDQIDSVSVEQMNAVVPASGLRKNGGVVVEATTGEVLNTIPGPTYTPPVNGQFPQYREKQGGVSRPGWAFEDGRPKEPFTIARPEGVYSRPVLILEPPQATSTFDVTNDTPPPRMPEGLENRIIKQITGTRTDTFDQRTLDELRSLISTESVFVPLHAEGIKVLHQGAGMERLDTLLTKVRASGGMVTAETFEPRGLKDLNGTGVIFKDGQPVSTGHGGGNQLIDEMIRANHLALTSVFGSGYAENGLAMTFRDRGKRFANVYGPGVTAEQVQKIQGLRREIYRSMSAQLQNSRGAADVMYLKSGSEYHPFQYDVGAAAVQLNPRVFPKETAANLRERLVAASAAGIKDSALKLGIRIVDGETPREMSEQRWLQRNGLRFLFPKAVEFSENNRRR